MPRRLDLMCSDALTYTELGQHLSVDAAGALVTPLFHAAAAAAAAATTLMSPVELHRQEGGQQQGVVGSILENRTTTLPWELPSRDQDPTLLDAVDLFVSSLRHATELVVFSAARLAVPSCTPAHSCCFLAALGAPSRHCGGTFGFSQTLLHRSSKRPRDTTFLFELSCWTPTVPDGMSHSALLF